MTHYIDADRLRAEIDRQEIGCNIDGKHAAEYDTCVKILRIIDSLHPDWLEVDLEKELDQWRHEHFAGKRDEHYNGEYLKRSSQLDLARHFAEWGAEHARKEE